MEKKDVVAIGVAALASLLFFYFVTKAAPPTAPPPTPPPAGKITVKDFTLEKV